MDPARPAAEAEVERLKKEFSVWEQYKMNLTEKLMEVQSAKIAAKVGFLRPSLI